MNATTWMTLALAGSTSGLVTKTVVDTVVTTMGVTTSTRPKTAGTTGNRSKLIKIP